MTQSPPKKLELVDIKNKLKTLSHADLMKLIISAYALSRDNKDFLTRQLLMDENDLDDYKAQLKMHLAPPEPWGKSHPISITKAKKVMSDYKKICKDQKNLIDLMLYYVEIGTDFVVEFDRNQSYCDSLLYVFMDTIFLLEKYNIKEIDVFINRINVVLEKVKFISYQYQKDDYLDDFTSPLERCTLINALVIPTYDY